MCYGRSSCSDWRCQLDRVLVELSKWNYLGHASTQRILPPDSALMQLSIKSKLVLLNDKCGQQTYVGTSAQATPNGFLDASFNVFDLMLLGLAHKGHKVDMNVILFLRNLKGSCNYRTDEEIDPVHVARLGVQRLLSPDLANQNS